MTKRIAYIILLVLALATAWYWLGKRKSTLTGPSTPASEPAPPTVERVRIAQFGDFFLYAPLYVAVDQGFFRNNGLDVEILSTGGDEKTWAAVLSGEALFGVSDPTFVAVAGQRGRPGKVVAQLVSGVPFWGVSYNESLPPLTSPAELRGKRVATFPAPSTAFVLQSQMFVSAGLEPAIVQAGFGAVLPVAKNGDADIALELEPNVSQATTLDGAHVVYSLAEQYGEFAMTGLTVLPRTLSERQELVRSATCALQQALDFLRSDTSRSLHLLRDRFPSVAPEVAAVALTRVLEANVIPTTLQTSEAAWGKAVGIRLAAGDLQAAPPAAFADYVGNQLALEAARNCRTAP